MTRASGFSETLLAIVADYAQRIANIDDAVLADKLRPDKWSRKEILGHLIDSAQNNLRRFITAQYEPAPPHIIYDQDFWVRVNRYNDVHKEDLLALWKLLNMRIGVVVDGIPQDNLLKLCNTGKDADEFHPLHYLATDYVAHMKHHLAQIVD
jgi:hypothetical protein